LHKIYLFKIKFKIFLMIIYAKQLILQHNPCKLAWCALLIFSNLNSPNVNFYELGLEFYFSHPMVFLARPIFSKNTPGPEYKIRTTSEN